MHGPKEEFLRGAMDTLPMVVGAIPFGILFGALAINAGLSVGATLGFSLFVFAGSSQFIAATLVAQGTGIAVIVLTTFVVNLRHALYSASIGPYLSKLPLRWTFFLSYWLTDETYAVVIQRFRQQDSSTQRHWYFLGSGLFMYCNWQLCTVIGIVSGQRLKGLADWGLEFAMVVTFIGIVVPMLRTRPQLLCALVAGSVAILADNLPHEAGLMIASFTAIAAGYFLETFTRSGDSQEVLSGDSAEGPVQTVDSHADRN